jgi:aminoglycoside 3-N-acetyltransferase
MKRTLRRAVQRVSSRISQDELRSTLARLVGGRSDTLVVHSSLSRCGYFTDGPVAVMQALREITGFLVLPTHTYCYPDAPDQAAPVFDAVNTPSRNGVLTELFRLQPDVHRSIHSTHSLAASGLGAPELTLRHYECDTPCGAGTPYDRLLRRGTSALMFGVTFHSYTFFHTAEDASGSSFAYEPDTVDRLRVRTEAGEERICLSRRQTRDARRFAETGELLERAGLVRSAMLREGRLLFAPDCVQVHDFLVERLRRTPDFLYQTCKARLQ